MDVKSSRSGLWYYAPKNEAFAITDKACISILYCYDPHRGDDMTIEELIDLQEAGSRARILGLAGHENPFLKAEKLPSETSAGLADWLSRRDAWKFGWEIENASREGNLVPFVRTLLPSVPTQRP